MTKIIALFHQSGGMAKTTLTLNLGYHLAERSNDVLVIDMDGQASLTKRLDYDPVSLSRTIYDALVEQTDLPVLRTQMQGTTVQMDLVPANRSLYALGEMLMAADDKQFRLRDALTHLDKPYDFILIDCPPSMGAQSINALVAATHVLVPMETTEKSFENAEMLLDTIKDVLELGNAGLQIAGVIPTRFEAGEEIHKATLERINKTFASFTKIHPTIRKRTDFNHALKFRVPLAVVNPKNDMVPRLCAIAAHLETL
ncbi:MAG: ParA family protein [Cyanobacteria bacterium P01_A01_bin.17]